MTLPTGTISLSQVNVELFKSATATISLNDADVRGLAGVPSGAIDLQDLQGKSAVFAYTITTDQSDVNLRSLALANGWNGTFPVQITLNSGVFICGSVAGNSTAALTINGSFPNGVTFINNGTVAGRGGTGGSNTGTAGQAGGLALAVSVAVTVQNNGTIAGGGGGGGAYFNFAGSASCSMGEDSCFYSVEGGGGGGGRSNTLFTALGGARLGGTGTATAPGAGGTGSTSTGVCPACNTTGGSGGSGGGWGSAGVAAYYAAGAAGTAVTGNTNITWTAFGTRLGAIT